MQNKIFITNQVEKVRRGEHTDFLDPNEELQVISILNKYKSKYNILKLFETSEKSIIYKESYPSITLLEIECSNKLCHKDILGALFSHDIKISKYGDIVISDKYYLPVLNSIKPYIISNIDTIGKNKVKFNEVNIDIIKDYNYDFEKIELLVSSLRLDSIVSSLTKCSRNQVDELFNDKYVFVNYMNNNKKTYLVKENDIIAIRKNGKYKYLNTSKITSKNKYIINILKYK